MCYNITYLEKRAQEYHDRYSHLIEDWRPDSIQGEFPMYYHVSGFAHPALHLIRQTKCH